VSGEKRTRSQSALNGYNEGQPEKPGKPSIGHDRASEKEGLIRSNRGQLTLPDGWWAGNWACNDSMSAARMRANSPRACSSAHPD